MLTDVVDVVAVWPAILTLWSALALVLVIACWPPKKFADDAMEPGVSVWVAFGGYGGFHVMRITFGLLICLGWVSIAILEIDLDVTFGRLLREHIGLPMKGESEES